MIKFGNSKLKYYIHGLFKFGVFTKLFNGIWETISGFLVLALNSGRANQIFYSITHRELLEAPHDKFIDFIIRTLQNFPHSARKFAAIYILFHGILNIFLAVELHLKRLWAYLVTIGATTIFIFYQLYRITLYHSRILSILTVIDIFFIILTWHEYKDQKNIATIQK